MCTIFSYILTPKYASIVITYVQLPIIISASCLILVDHSLIKFPIWFDRNSKNRLAQKVSQLFILVLFTTYLAPHLLLNTKVQFVKVALLWRICAISLFAFVDSDWCPIFCTWAGSMLHGLAFITGIPSSVESWYLIRKFGSSNCKNL